MFDFSEKLTDEENYYPNCDLVACSYVDINREANGFLTIKFSWDRKEKNYKMGTPISAFVVRHGPMNASGEVDEESGIVKVFQKPVRMEENYFCRNEFWIFLGDGFNYADRRNPEQELRLANLRSDGQVPISKRFLETRLGRHDGSDQFLGQEMR